MKTNQLLTLSIAALLACFASPTQAQTGAKEQLVVPLSDAGKPGSLQVNLINGTIRVTGYSGNQVVIDAVVKSPENDEKPKSEAAGGMKRISRNGGLELTATEEHNVVKLTTKMVNTTMLLEIKVPRKFGLKVGTINNGDIVIDNVSGEMEIQNVNGDITLTNISGSAVANTINGTLKANFKTIDTSSPMAFSTLNGNVDVTIPATAKFDVKLKSDRGEIYSDFDVDVDKSTPQATRSAKDGMYKVSIDDWVKGKINGGGSEIMMKNMNGNIYVRKAK
ncbi:DUF4097 domain-containing protein [Dyadobacter chenwenxiniae]|uniref:DUF4097 domain-containing protein n=1 Tax=Dyadobacter chenwenxiniae TaxID=2906456 RepID=A0A9X1PKA2_9BACT|nr:DUF4097 family beta strand repeat-containing protein [Dyadobacter chenwenxiniae]MCF0062977.1 DUF4097 domain-containing protein [Dyadobacter chenwenxiniae]UON84849.1 DUF4097 domain-containing protein [Dyadobacter chenwenxiniae]